MPKTNEDFLIKVKADIDQAVGQLKKFAGEVDKTGNAGGKAKKGLGGMAGSMGTIVTVAGAYMAINLAKNLLKQADAWNVLQSRIKTATRDTGDYVQVSQELYDISQKNGQQMETTVALFQNLARTAPELQATNRDMLALTNTVQQLGIISGTTQSQQRAGLLQFSQGLAGGVFRAEEFNSLIENLPELANRIAKGMGKTTGELRQAVLEGRVLSKEVFDAIQKQAADINTQFLEMPDSVKLSGTAMDNSFKNILATLDQVISGTQKISSLYRDIAGRMDYAAQLLQEDELGEAVRERGEVMIAYQQTLARGFAEDDIHLERYLIKIDELDAKIKALQPKIAGGFDFVGPAPKPTAAKTTPPIIAPITKEEQKAIDDYSKSISALTARLDPAGTATHKLYTDLDLLNKLFFEDNAISGDRYDQLTEALLGASEATKKAVEDLDAMDRALDLIEQQFADLDEAEARQIAGLEKVTKTGVDGFDEMNAAIRGWGDNFTNTLVDMAMTGKASFSDLTNAIIRDLLRMAVYQNITKPLFGAMGMPIGTNHSGGIAGTGASKNVNPMAFINAPRYHSGGIAGLRSNEVPAILEQGEEVLTRDDPRHIANRSGGGSVRVELTNNGTPQEATSAETTFDGDEMVISIATQDIKRGGALDSTLQRTYNLSRK